MTEPAHDATVPRPSRSPHRRGRASGQPGAVVALARLAGPPAALAVVATVALAVALESLEGHRNLAVNIWLLTIGGLVMWTCLRAVAAALPTSTASAFDSVRVRDAEPPSKLDGVVAIEGAIIDSEWSPGGVEYRLRPLLRKIAAARLMERNQVDLETEPVAAHRLLGDELWALITPEVPYRAALADSDSPVQDTGARPPFPWTRNRKRPPRHSARDHQTRHRRTGGTVSRDEGVTEYQRAAALADSVMDEVERVVIGKRAVLELVLLALISDGHVLIEDLPGLAKTLMARSFADVIKLRFARIQFTPDLMPSDVTGARSTTSAARVHLPARTRLREPPSRRRDQSGAGQDSGRTAGGDGGTPGDGRRNDRQLERPFLVIATQNPIEAEGTYPLPEAQLDRFMMRISVGHPERDQEIEMLERRAARRTDDVTLKQVLDPVKLRWMQGVAETVFISPDISAYMVDLVRATRSSPLVQVGASPRGSLALLKLARSRATISGRDFVIPEDVKAVAVPALAHRIILSRRSGSSASGPTTLFAAF